MANKDSRVVLRSVEDLADAKELRAAISGALAQAPVNEHTLRSAVWNFVATERRAGVPPEAIITRLAALIGEAQIAPLAAHLRLTRRVILWCVEEYFDDLGAGDLLALEGSQRMPATATPP